MKELIEDIKGQDFKHVYLLYGDENYLKKQYRSRLVSALIPDTASMNLNRYEGDHANEGQIIDQAETYPFLGERRVIDVYGSDFFKKGSDLLSDYIEHIPEYTYLIFTEDNVDKRNRLFKAVKKYGRVVEFGEQRETTLVSWLLRLFTDAGLKIRKSDMEYLLSKTGSDMNHIHLEADKVIAYCNEKELEVITTEVIDHVLTERLENRIFDMISGISAKDRQKVMDLYSDLIALKESPMRILYLIGRQFRQMLIIKELKEEGASVERIAKAAGMPPFAVRRQLQHMGMYDRRGLKRCIDDCVKAETDVKTGQMGEKLALELILIRMTAK